MSSLPDDALLRFDNAMPSPRRRGAAWWNARNDISDMIAALARELR